LNWHPQATRDPYASAGRMLAGRPKLVWHTTEGSSLPRYSNSAPHFTLNPRTGQLWQHMPINEAAKALEHPVGTVETNRGGAIQVELIGFARDTDDWPDSSNERIANLARWIEREAGVAAECTVPFSGVPGGAPRMSAAQWLNYNGHCGHQHVPHNHHWDPGGFKILKVLTGGGDASPHRTLRVRRHGGPMSGPDVVALQQAVNRRAARCGRRDHRVRVDGKFGAATIKHAAWALFVLGVNTSQEKIIRGGLSDYEQTLLRNPNRRNRTQKTRAAARRRRHCRTA
jgi:hypothetical protein